MMWMSCKRNCFYPAGSTAPLECQPYYCTVLAQSRCSGHPVVPGPFIMLACLFPVSWIAMFSYVQIPSIGFMIYSTNQFFPFTYWFDHLALLYILIFGKANLSFFFALKIFFLDYFFQTLIRIILTHTYFNFWRIEFFIFYLPIQGNGWFSVCPNLGLCLLIILCNFAWLLCVSWLNLHTTKLIK